MILSDNIENKSLRSVLTLALFSSLVHPMSATLPPESVTDTPESAADAVFHGIVQGLAQQRFVPGQRLVEVDLAAQFGVSRASVREALQRLAAQGLVELFRNKGAAIRTLSAQETLEVLDVAERMTGLLARSAARAIAAGAQRAPIQAALAQLHEADRGQDTDAFASARRGMYRALLDTGRSRELRRLLPSIHMPIVYAQHRPAALQQVRMRDYKAMCQAVLAGDENGADAAGMAHVRHVRESIVSLQHAAPTDVPPWPFQSTQDASLRSDSGGLPLRHSGPATPRRAVKARAPNNSRGS